jgi:hypothetical protein
VPRQRQVGRGEAFPTPLPVIGLPIFPRPDTRTPNFPNVGTVPTTALPIAPPSSPTPAPEFRPTGPLPSGGLSEESIRQTAERAVRDTEIRQSAPPRRPVAIEGEFERSAGRGVGRSIFRRVLGPIGVIWEIITPNVFGSGEIDAEEYARREREADRREFERESSIGQDIARGAGTVILGGAIGAGVIIDQLGRLPPLPDVREPTVDVEVPPVSIPEPRVVGPELRGLPSPPVPSLPLPSPAPSTRGTPSRGSQTVPRSRRRGSTTPAPTAGVPSWAVLGTNLGSLLLQQLLQRSRSRTRTPFQVTSTLTPPLTSSPPIVSSPPIASSPAVPTAPGSPFPSPLTPVQPSVGSSSPPRTPTRTSTDQCNCQPKRKRPARKCRARAGVIWAGGPKKGQLAGSRCISFEK